MTDEIEKGKSVRGGKLVPNTKYVMRAWGKPPIFSFAWFLGAGTSLATATAPEGQLKAQSVGTIFYFKIDDNIVEILPGSGWLGFPNDRGEPDPSKRVTFFLPIGDAVEDSKQIIPDTAAEHEVQPTEDIDSSPSIESPVESEAEQPEEVVAFQEQVTELVDDQPEVPETVMPVAEETEVITETQIEQDPYLVGIMNRDNVSDDQPVIDTAAIAEHIDEVFQKEETAVGEESTSQRKARLKRERRAAARSKQIESIEG